MAGIQKNADIAFSIRVLRNMNQSFVRHNLINSFLRIFKGAGRLQLCGGGGGGVDFVGTCGGPSENKSI